jgi:hypothetical protein
MSFLFLTTENLFSSFLLGLLFTILFFAVSFFLVVGVKFCYLLWTKKLSQEKEVKVCPFEKLEKKKKRAKIRTLYLDPDEVDRIYVRKSS